MTIFIIGIIIFVAGLITILVIQHIIKRTKSENAALRSRMNSMRTMFEHRDVPISTEDKDAENQTDTDYKTAEDVFKAFCEEKRCECTLVEEDEGDRNYKFLYQGGTFTCYIDQRYDDTLLLSLSGFITKPYTTQNLQSVRDMCEELNYNYRYGKLVYTYENDNRLSVHIDADIFNPTPQLLEFYIKACFLIAGKARDMLNNPHVPSEEDIIRRRREQQMIQEGEIAHQQPFHANAQNLPRVGDIRHLMTIFFRQEEDVEDMLSMTLVRDTETEQIVQRDKIAHFNVFSTMIDGEGAEAQMRATPAVLSLETTFRHYTFTLHPVSDNKDTIYIRLTALMVPYDNLQHDMPEGAYVPQSLSVLLTYDRDAEKTLEHYRLRSEIQKKPGNIKALYEYGHQLVLEKRFTEAVIALTPLFNTMRHNFFHSSEERRKLFFDLCYDLGYCYTDLRQYEMAFYYLSLAHPQNRIDYSSEYFNCLANSEDIRIFRELTLEKEQIERLVKEIDDSDESGMEENVQRREQLANYYAFLQRRYGYALINCNKLDDAENVFKSLLNHAPSHDYAQHELDYIAQLKKQHPGNSKDNNTHKPLLP